MCVGLGLATPEEEETQWDSGRVGSQRVAGLRQQAGARPAASAHGSAGVC